MRKLAQELDAGAATLYWHVGDKEQLLGLLLDRIVGENQVARARPGELAGQLKVFARATRDGCLPSRRDSAQLSIGRGPAGPNSLPMMERTLALLASAALPPQVISYAADLFALYVGSVRLRGAPLRADPGTRPSRWAVPQVAPAGAVPADDRSQAI